MERLRNHLSTKELKQRYLNCLDPAEAKRWYFLWQVSRSQTIKQAACLIGINYDYALTLVRKYNRFGPESIKDQRKVSPKIRKLLAQEFNVNSP